MRKNSTEANRDQALLIPKNLESDGLDVEFSMELADRDDLEALERSRAADERAHSRQ